MASGLSKVTAMSGILSKGVVFADSLPDFRTYVREARQPSRAGRRRGLWIDIYGSLSDLRGPLGRRVRRLAKKRFFHDASGPEIARELVNTIRSASRDPNAGGRIGRSCMTVVVPRDGSEAILTVEAAKQQIETAIGLYFTNGDQYHCSLASSLTRHSSR